jgi:hypothetical protein
MGWIELWIVFCIVGTVVFGPYVLYRHIKDSRELARLERARELADADHELFAAEYEARTGKPLIADNDLWRRTRSAFAQRHEHELGTTPRSRTPR